MGAVCRVYPVFKKTIKEEPQAAPDTGLYLCGGRIAHHRARRTDNGFLCQRGIVVKDSVCYFSRIMDFLYRNGVGKSKAEKLQSPSQLYDAKLCPYLISDNVKGMEICDNKYHDIAANGCVQGGGMGGLGGESGCGGIHYLSDQIEKPIKKKPTACKELIG